jgi:hypothetical protein
MQRLKALVKTVAGRTRHGRATIINGLPCEVERIPAPAWVEIAGEPEGFYLLHFDAKGNCIADTWHATLDEAKAQAHFEFLITSDEWQTLCL